MLRALGYLVRVLGRIPGWIALGLIFGYQRLVSPVLTFVFGSGCRFHPTCSEFARKAILRYGLPRGGAMTLGRLARCHPFHPGGYDPPELRS